MPDYPYMNDREKEMKFRENYTKDLKKSSSQTPPTNSEQTTPNTKQYTDEAFLHQYFHYYLKNMYGTDVIRNMFMDGFEEPLDPDYLCDAIYSLAERLGYKLVDNMWQEVAAIEQVRKDLNGHTN